PGGTASRSRDACRRRSSPPRASGFAPTPPVLPGTCTRECSSLLLLSGVAARCGLQCRADRRHWMATAVPPVDGRRNARLRRTAQSTTAPVRRRTSGGFGGWAAPPPREKRPPVG